jgi:Transmembrane domain of unknown function (DUF3566)
VSETSRNAASGSAHARPDSGAGTENAGAQDSGERLPQDSGVSGPASWSPVYGPIPTGPQAHAQPLGQSTLPEGVRLPAPGEPLPPAPVPVWAPQPPQPPKKSLGERLGLSRLGLGRAGSGPKSSTAAAPTPLAAAAAAVQEEPGRQAPASGSAPYGASTLPGQGPSLPGVPVGPRSGAGSGPTTAVIPAVAAVGPGATAAGSGVLTSPLPKITPPRRTRKARLRLARLDPWSVMKTAFLFSIAGGIMLVVAVYVVWTVLEASQLFTSFNDIVKSVLSTPGDTTPFRIEEYVNTQKVMGVTALLACVNVVIFTALATLGSFLYNLAATMLGGLEITLAED